MQPKPRHRQCLDQRETEFPEFFEVGANAYRFYGENVACAFPHTVAVKIIMVMLSGH